MLQHTSCLTPTDIAMPLSGALNLFNLYIALSRSHGQSQIYLLCDFDENIFLKTHCNELLMEDDQLEEKNSRTCNWWKAFSHPMEKSISR
ncbi:hypothetical protein PISMIDRAFT_93137 [Pisolithus microcarpus 441]|uniref:Uncharacterized protein n=1 Tax=Pisolithus microcarpus 441 TaxID=765257 RepID=A0A0C9ZYS5_9AGAM|nr:hypothetical protein BKA83DRAFT_93137 [Pisolithus microcarpus]KIK27362.1 hypothetical protein PISMIDRAFT_93137 [Pisolithus microcarpus 441]